jgi:DNA polymerase
LSRKEVLDVIASEIVVCTKCRLWKGRKKAVPGEGSPESQIMFVGEGPGGTEDLEGRPFVGQAGKFLDALLSETCLARENVFICNIVRCRPPANRAPLQDEIQACTPYLDRQMKTIQPKVVVTLGNCSTGYIFSKANLRFNGITRVRGGFYEKTILGMHIRIFPSFHPAAALYSAKYKEQLTKDFQTLKGEVLKRQLANPSS